jgi:hypothetical protein
MNFNSLITGPARFGLKLGAQVFGALQSRFGGGGVDDATLQRRVEAEIQASRRAPKGKVEVNVAEGVAWLRGEVKTKTAIEELETRAGSVEGVDRVENLLRVAKAAKPAARAKSQKRPAPKRSTEPKPAAATAPPPEAEPAPQPTPPPAAQEERPVTRRFNAEQTSGSDAEPTPSELADTGEGRRPAPLGATVGSPPAPFPSAPETNGAATENGTDGGDHSA